MYKHSSMIAMIFIVAWVLFSAVACGPPPPASPPEEPPAAAISTTAAPPATPSPGEQQPAQENYIDTHMHLVGQYRSGNKRVNDFDTATGNLIALMDQYGLARSLIVVVPTHTGQSGQADYETVRAMVKLYPDRLHLMAGGATLGLMIYETDAAAITPELQKEFEAKADKLITAGAKGFGEMLALHLCLSETHSFYNIPPDHPLYLLLADIAARHGVPIDLHMEAVPEDMPMPANLTQACDKNPATLPATIPAFERLLAHNRETKIVWQHIGWDNTGYMTIDLVRRLLDDHPNLYIALKIEVRGHQVGPAREPMPNRIVDEKWQVRPEWLEFISDYPDRIMIGADEFVGVSGRAVHGAPSFSQTWDIIDQLPPDLAGQVGRDNAARVYNLGQ